MYKLKLSRIAVTALVLASCSPYWRGGWYSEHGRENPLVGRILDVPAGAWIDEQVLFDRLAAARFVLLGEHHDNPDHHWLQGRTIRALVDRGRKPAVVMEMLDTGETQAIAKCLDDGCTPRRLAKAVDWKSSGWPDWRTYEPVLAAALDADLPVAPASLPADAVRDYARTGTIEGGDAEIGRLRLDRPVSKEVRDAMAEEIREAHCGHAPEGMIEPMIAVQRLRDAVMADSLLLAAPMGRAVLIAGLGHARNDRGVPPYLEEDLGDDKALSVGFVEVDDERMEPAAYASSFGSEHLPFDFVWFTPRFDESDPCERFRRQLEKLRPPSAR